MTKNVLKVLLGGCSSIRVGKNAVGVAFSGPDSWNEIYNPVDFEWTKREEKDLPVAVATQHGSGRDFAIGDVDIFSDDELYGLKSMDNELFVANALRWLTSPSNQEDVINWILMQVGHIGDQMESLEKKFQNVIETTQLLEERISRLEGLGKLGESARDLEHARGILHTAKQTAIEQENE